MKVALPTRVVKRGAALVHVSRTQYARMPFYFGSASNRYDDPAGRYGVLYTAFNLPTALMESLFHSHEWSAAPGRVVNTNEIDERLVRHLGVLEPLAVLDLTQEGVMAGRFGLNLEQLSGRDYTHTRRIALMAHREPDIDGIVYPSRNNFPGTCLALFDRCRDKVASVVDIPLPQHPGWPSFMEQYRIRSDASQT
ncbi:MAG: RES family NAD+ phosphorylase [Gammaproteobacteria bacterium]